MKTFATIWNLFKFGLTLCSFFWFGWQVGVLMLIMNIGINGK